MSDSGEDSSMQRHASHDTAERPKKNSSARYHDSDNNRERSRTTDGIEKMTGVGAMTQTTGTEDHHEIDHTTTDGAQDRPHQSDPDVRENESFRDQVGDVATSDGGPPAVEKQKPNYKPTGLLAKEANTIAGTTTVLKYHEPPEARKPPSKQQWRMYVFKEKDLLDTIYLYSRSAWLVGRDEKVTDYLLDHPSVSKQHAVVQFRYRTSTDEFGDKTSKVKPYLIDLDSARGTKLNGENITAAKYVELIDGDVVGFGDSEREYVMMLPPANV